MTTPREFIALALAIEGVGVSAYLGTVTVADITSKAHLAVVSSILVMEVLHRSATRGAVAEIPMVNIFGTP